MNNENIIVPNWLQHYIDRLDMHIAEQKKSNEEFKAEMKEMNKNLGGLSNSLGECAEDFFYEALLNRDKNLFGEPVNSIMSFTKCRKVPDEYDILIINCTSVCIVEVKHVARKDDIPKLLKKAETIKINMPEYQNHTIYLGLAAMSFKPHIINLCKEHGIAIIKEVSNSVVIIHDNLKAY